MNIVCTITKIQPFPNGKAKVTFSVDPVFGGGEIYTMIDSLNNDKGIVYSIDGEVVDVGQGLSVEITKWKNPS